MKRLTLVLGAVAIAMLPASSALGETFDFHFSGPAFWGSGSFNATPDGGNQYTINGISGSVSDFAGSSNIAALLAPGSYPTGTGPLGIPEIPNDNLLFYPSFGDFDAAGVSFVLANGIDVNLNNFIIFENAVAGSGHFTEPAQFTITDAGSSPSPTPEPGSLFLLGTGVLGVAGAVRRKVATVITA